MRTRRPIAALLLLSVACWPAAAQEAGDNIVKRGRIAQDLYLAGGTVEVLANVDGDVVAAGGQVSIDNGVSGDVMAAGGTVAVRGRVADDVRLAGGNVTISGAVGDDAIAAGGNVLLARGATVGGRAWFGGNSVNVAGKVEEELKAGGNRVVIAGEIGGDVEVYAETLEIQPGAVIAGNVNYYSRDEARIANDARIAGTVTRHRLRPGEEMQEGMRVIGGIARIGLYLSLMLTAVVYYLLFPQASIAAARTLNGSPWKSLGLGLAILAATPLVVALLFASLVGVWLALIALTLYLLILLLGFLTAILAVGDWGLHLLGRSAAPSKGWRVLSIVATFVALWLVRWVPVLGGLVVFALLVFGLGALTLYLWRRYVSA